MKIFQVGVDETTLAFLRNKGFEVATDEVETTEDLYDWVVDGLYDAVVINLDATSWSIFAVRYLRSKNILTAVVGLTNSDEDTSWSEQRATFLENGGDDFLKNPVNPRELAASLRAATRRGKGLVLDVREFKIEDAVIRVNLSTQTVMVNDKPAHLTIREMQIFLVLVSHRGRVQTKEMLLNAIYSSIDDEPLIKIIDVFVCKVRKKLNAAHSGAGKIIETVWGRGYQIVSEEIQKQRNDLEERAGIQIAS